MKERSANEKILFLVSYIWNGISTKPEPVLIKKVPNFTIVKKFPKDKCFTCSAETIDKNICLFESTVDYEGVLEVERKIANE